MKRFGKRSALFGIAALIVGLAVVAAFGQLATRATPSNVERMAGNEQEIFLKAADGVKIAASFFPAKDPDSPVVLMLHGNGASRGQFAGHVGWLNAAGFSAMSIDFRGHGESDRKSKSFGWFESRDAEAAVRWIRRTHPNAKIGAIGMSLGGASALLGANGPLDVDAMVLQAVYPDINRAIRNRVASQGHWTLATVITPLLTSQSYFRYGVGPERISPIISARRYNGPVLVIGGEKDSYTPIQETRALFSAFRGRRSLWIMPGLEHYQINGGDDPEYAAKVTGFFNEHLRMEQAGNLRH